MNKKFSNEEIELMIADANASMAMEGFKPDKQNDELTREFLRGNISEEELLNEIYILIKENNSKVP